MYSKGISWINDCRIPFVDEKDPSAKRYETRRNTGKFNELGYGFNEYYGYVEQQGRFPSNLLVSDDMLNDGICDKGTNSRYYDIDKWFDNLIDD